MSVLSKRGPNIAAMQSGLNNSLKNHSATLQQDLQRAMHFWLWALINHTQAGEIDTTDVQIMRTEYAEIVPLIRAHQAIVTDMESLTQGTPEEVQARIAELATKYGFDYAQFDAAFGL